MIPFNNLKHQYLKYQKAIDQAVLRVMKSGLYLLGPELEKFEKEFSHYLGAKYAAGLASGTDALTLAVKALDLAKNDEVIIPANAYPTAFGVALSGARIKLCDVEVDTLNVSARTIASAITKKTKALVVVHLYGLPAPMLEIIKLAKKNNLAVIEDCAQSIGARINHQLTGTFGDFGCFSFYPTKNLAALGDGGAIITNNQKILKQIKQLRMYGEDQRYHSLMIANHSRLEEIQAAILRVRLKKLALNLRQRQKLANYYRQNLPEKMLIPGQISPTIKHAYHLLVIRSPRRRRLRQSLSAKGIETAIHYPAPIHLQPAFRHLGYQKGDFPVSELACKQVLSLPFYPGLKQTDQRRIILAIRQG